MFMIRLGEDDGLGSFNADYSEWKAVDCTTRGVKKVQLAIGDKTLYSLFVEITDTVPTWKWRSSCPALIYNPIDTGSNQIRNRYKYYEKVVLLQNLINVNTRNDIFGEDEMKVYIYSDVLE